MTGCGALETLIKHDLPERLDPMMAKELRQSLRRSGFVLPFLAIQFFALVAMVSEFRNGHTAADSGFAGVLNPWLVASSGPFWIVVAVVCMVLMPLGGLVLMGQELEEGNHELLLLTKLNRWKVVVGKFITLWGLSVVTFVSLLPYMVVRYLVGGIEWWHEAACAGTVLGGSAMIGAGAIGASAFRGVGARIAVMFLFLLSMMGGCAVPLAAAAARTDGFGILYFINALSAVACFTIIGLALARSRLRLAVMAYEVKPGGMLIGLLVFAPFVIGMITAFTIGYGGFVGLALTALVAARMDLTPKAMPSHQPVDALGRRGPIRNAFVNAAQTADAPDGGTSQ
jgi:ABC-type transport system involved in multi-copper enzyme maturation permease subunit